MLVLDLWDLLAVLGVALVLGGLAAMYWPVALIVCGLLMLGTYYLRERTLAAEPTPPGADEPGHHGTESE